MLNAHDLRAEAIAAHEHALACNAHMEPAERAELQEGLDLLRSGAGYAAVRWTARSIDNRTIKVGWSEGVFVPGYGHIAYDAHSAAVARRDGRDTAAGIAERWLKRNVRSLFAEEVRLEPSGS